MKVIEVYQGVKIVEDSGHPDYPVSTVEENVPILGEMVTGHRSIEKAKAYIDQIMKHGTLTFEK